MCLCGIAQTIRFDARAANSAMYIAKRQTSSYAFFRTTSRGMTEIHCHGPADVSGQLSCVGHRTDCDRRSS